jgi:hypothetical protein
MWALLDGTFRNFCRFARDGYAGMAQRRYHHYGNNHQGLETPDGIIVEMHGPFEGQTHDMRMLREFRLLERALLHCTCLSYLAAGLVALVS